MASIIDYSTDYDKTASMTRVLTGKIDCAADITCDMGQQITVEKDQSSLKRSVGCSKGG